MTRPRPELRTLTDEQVRTVRRVYGTPTLGKLAREWGATRQTLLNAARRVTYKDVV